MKTTMCIKMQEKIIFGKNQLLFPIIQINILTQIVQYSFKIHSKYRSFKQRITYFQVLVNIRASMHLTCIVQLGHSNTQDTQNTQQTKGHTQRKPNAHQANAEKTNTQQISNKPQKTRFDQANAQETSVQQVSKCRKNPRKHPRFKDDVHRANRAT